MMNLQEMQNSNNTFTVLLVLEMVAEAKEVLSDTDENVEEILKAEDKELNRWCSIKKTCQYRQKDEEKYDVQAFKKKAQIPALKQKILTSVYSEPIKEDSETDDKSAQTSTQKKKRRKKKKSKTVNVESEMEPNIHSNDKEEHVQDSRQNIESLVESPTSKKKKHSTNNNEEFCTAINEEKEESDLTCNKSMSDDNNEITNSKRKRKRSKKNKNADSETVSETHSFDAQTRNSTNSNTKKTTFSQSALDNDESMDITLDSPKSKLNLSTLEHPSKRFKSEPVDYGGVFENQTTEPDSVNKSKNTENDGNSTNETTSKKRKKKKKKSKNANNVEGQQKVKKPFYSSYKNQSRQETDKRLSLADSRYAAYNINPKKFKNKIKYSKHNK
ncbi:protein FAM133B-like [Parasteatoda tepidariorum]|uniref:protein FAM133B-like n=1 Tax=Parasteatoda tepidariorum TaxID=114398 RepID=UPI0039BD0047